VIIVAIIAGDVTKSFMWTFLADFFTLFLSHGIYWLIWGRR
jgi:hypothetical protein